LFADEDFSVNDEPGLPSGVILDAAKHNGQPFVAELDVPITDILEDLSDELDFERVKRLYIGLTNEHLTEILRYAAASVELRHQHPSQKLRQPYLASQLALKYPSPQKVYRLFDAEEEKALADLSAFQLAYLKAQMFPPHDESEGWYFTKEAAAKISLDYQALLESVEAVDEEASALEQKLKEREAGGDVVDYDEVARLVVKAELFEAKSAELAVLEPIILAALGHYDAFELYWETLP
jgi:uncharacterized protein (DUF433 family)